MLYFLVAGELKVWTNRPCEPPWSCRWARVQSTSRSTARIQPLRCSLPIVIPRQGHASGIAPARAGKRFSSARTQLCLHSQANSFRKANAAIAKEFQSPSRRCHKADLGRRTRRGVIVSATRGNRPSCWAAAQAASSGVRSGAPKSKSWLFSLIPGRRGPTAIREVMRGCHAKKTTTRRKANYGVGRRSSLYKFL
jgi:hypothetical protein